MLTAIELILMIPTFDEYVKMTKQTVDFKRHFDALDWVDLEHNFSELNNAFSYCLTKPYTPLITQGWYQNIHNFAFDSIRRAKNDKATLCILIAKILVFLENYTDNASTRSDVDKMSHELSQIVLK